MFLNDLLQSRSFDRHSVKFENCLLEDEKALTLLQTTFYSLDNELNDQNHRINPIIKSILELNINDLGEHSVFSITRIRKNSQLQETDLDEAIKSLTDHLKEFTKSLQSEIVQIIEQLERVFEQEDGQKLQ